MLSDKLEEENIKKQKLETEIAKLGNPDPVAFDMSNKTKQTINILEDVGYSPEDWIAEYMEAGSWSVQIAKIWFAFSKDDTNKPDMQIPAIFDDDKFVENVVKPAMKDIEEEQIRKFLSVISNFL